MIVLINNIFVSVYSALKITDGIQNPGDSLKQDKLHGLLALSRGNIVLEYNILLEKVYSGIKENSDYKRVKDVSKREMDIGASTIIYKVYLTTDRRNKLRKRKEKTRLEEFRNRPLSRVTYCHILFWPHTSQPMDNTFHTSQSFLI